MLWNKGYGIPWKKGILRTYLERADLLTSTQTRMWILQKTPYTESYQEMVVHLSGWNWTRKFAEKLQSGGWPWRKLGLTNQILKTRSGRMIQRFSRLRCMISMTRWIILDPLFFVFHWCVLTSDLSSSSSSTYIAGSSVQSHCALWPSNVWAQVGERNS